MTALTLAGAMFVPWIVGVAFVVAMPRRDALVAADGGVAWTIGAGWFAGVLALTLWMRALAALGVPFGLVTIGAPLLIAAGAMGVLARGRELPGLRAALVASARMLRGHPLAGWRRALWLLLLAWLATRALLLLSEVTLRPLFPWESWTIWATKARVFFETRTIDPFVPADAWLREAGRAWFDAAPDASLTVPLMTAWTCFALGTFDDVLMNLPWWIAGVALALTVFGALRQAALPPLAALAGTWGAVSFPLLSAHVALAGYADLFLTGAVTVCALALHRYALQRKGADLALALVFAASLPLFKNNGVAWIAALAPGIAAAVLPSRGARVAGVLFGVAAALLVVMTRVSVPVGGETLHLDFAPQWPQLGQRLFLLDNWHLLWYAATVVALAGVPLMRSTALRPLALTVAGGVAYALIASAFPAARDAFGLPGSANRTFLVVAPLAAFLVVVAAREATIRAAQPSAPAPAP